MSGQARGQVDTEPLLTKRELAGEFQVSERTVRRWIADGAPHIRVGHVVRLRQSAVEAWMHDEQDAA